MPPHVFLLVAVGASLVAGYRLAHRSLKKHRAEAEKERAKQEAAQSNEPRDLGSLDYDADSGSYKPRHH